MNRLLKIIGIVIIAYLFIAYALPKIVGIPMAMWNSGQILNETENPKIIKKGATEELEKIIAENLKGKSEINPEIALKSIIELYQKNENIAIESNEKPIGIYVIYGTDYWKEDSETFELCFAHQKVDSNNGNLYEYRIDMIYEPNNFKGIEEFDVRYNSNMDIVNFKKSIIISIGFKKAFDIEPTKVEIIKEQI
ncbi:hypothetical protein [Lacinutrix sp. MEBiC02595]